MATQANYFDRYDNDAQPVPIAQIKPIIAAPRDPNEAAQEARAEVGTDINVSSEARAGRKDVRDAVLDLQDRFRRDENVKKYEGALPNYVAALKTQPTTSGDTALVYHFAKTVDPTSTVGTGDMENIQATDARLPSLAQKWLTELRLSDGKFTDRAREGLRAELRQILQQREQSYMGARDLYAELAQAPEFGVRPELVIGKTPFGERFKADIDSYWSKRDETGAAPQQLGLEAGATFSTEQDKAIRDATQQAWQSGADLQGIVAAAQAAGGNITPNDIANIQAAIEARAKGQSVTFNPSQTGQRSPLAQAAGEALMTPAGTALTGAVNAAGAGLLSQVAGDQVQGLEALNPKSAIGGEIVGSMLGTAGLAGGTSAALRMAAPALAERVAGGGLAGAIGREALTEGAYGGLYAANTGQDIGTGVALGAAGSLGGRAVGAGLQRAPSATLNRIGNFLNRSDGGNIPPDGGAGGGVPPAGGMPPMGNAPTSGPSAGASMAGGIDQMAAQADEPFAPVNQAMTPEASAEVGTIIRDAVGTGKKANVAQIKLAEMAQVNPEAMDAAQRLGLEIPADVFSDSPQVRAAVGLTRSLAGSEAEASWRNTVSAAVDTADNVMRNFDAQFVEGAVSPGVVSQRVKESLTTTRAALNKQAGDIYEQVDQSVPKNSPINLSNLAATLGQIKQEVGIGGMTAQERNLSRLLNGKEKVTYGRLIREKNLIGKALSKQESPYGSMDEATLKRLYAALATDQLDNVGAIAGDEMRKQLRGANLIYAKERALAKRIVNAFGNDLEGGIAGKMRAAITGAAKGDPGEFTRLMKAVPDDLRREVVATALTAATRSGRGAERGGFGFSEFADMYPKLRANPPVYKQIVDALGKDAAGTLRDLWVVSKRITEARANVLTTGKANQAMLGSMNAEGVLGRIMDSTATKRAVGAAMGALGPVAGAVMPDIMAAMTKGKPDAVRAAGKLFISPEFQEMLTRAAIRPEAQERAISKVVRSKSFLDFGKTIGLDPKESKGWLRSIIDNKE